MSTLSNKAGNNSGESGACGNVSATVAIRPRSAAVAEFGFGLNMGSHGERVMLAAITAPVAVVPTSAAWAVWYYATSSRTTPDALMFPDPDKPWEFVLLFSMYGIFTAYLSLPIFVPLYYAIRHLRLISYSAMIIAGMITCIPAALFYGRPGDAFGRILIFLLPYGAAVAALFLWRMKQSAEPGPPGNSRPAGRPTGS